MLESGHARRALRRGEFAGDGVREGGEGKGGGSEEGDSGVVRRVVGMWEKLWGDHMHHGFYEPGEWLVAVVVDHRMA